MENIHELQHPLLAKPPRGAPAGETRREHPSFFARPSWRHLPPPPPELAQQLLDAGTLQRTVEPLGSPEPAPDLDPTWKAGEPPSWRKQGYCETAFGEPAERPKKLCLEKDIHTVCCEVSDRELLPEFEVRGGWEPRHLGTDGGDESLATCNGSVSSRAWFTGQVSKSLAHSGAGHSPHPPQWALGFPARWVWGPPALSPRPQKQFRAYNGTSGPCLSPQS
nr:uncharacterized protein LOC116833846 [Chelonoidis abingdonii]